MLLPSLKALAGLARNASAASARTLARLGPVGPDAGLERRLEAADVRLGIRHADEVRQDERWAALMVLPLVPAARRPLVALIDLRNHAARHEFQINPLTLTR